MKSVKEKSKKIFWFKIGMLFITAIYFLTHIIALTELPVFADEAIYIRWAQLIIDDWKQYLFFSMNDGKTPLFIWLITSALNLWKDPLHAGRMISVIVGIFQIGIAIKTVEKLKGGLVAQMLAAFSVMFLPFWYFHHRMALMDALLTLFLSCSFLFLIKAQLEKKETKKTAKVNIQRYKGLGEMNPGQLWDTTMNPETRFMKVVNINEAARADEIFEVLMGAEVAPRKKFIQTHAKSVKNLDI